MKISLLLILVLGTFNLVHAKKRPVEINKVSLMEKSYPKDATVKAQILLEDSETFYNDDNRIVTKFHKIIKIYTKKGFSYGTQKVYLSKSGRLEESISRVKGVTYSLVNGKIIKEKLIKDHIFRKYDKRGVVVTLALPNITEGCIIEFSYELLSPFNISISPVYIQKRIPIKSLYYSIEIPEHYNYNIQTRGTEFIDVKKSLGNGSRYITYKSDGKTRSYTSNFLTNIYTIKANNVAPFVKEPYVDNIYNYISSVNFYLRSINYSNAPVKVYARSWGEIITEKIKVAKPIIKKSNYYKKDLEQVLISTKNDRVKALAIFNFVRKRMRWNKNYSSYSPKKISSIYEKKIGTSADINSILWSMLLEANLEVKPVYVSTSRMKQSIMPDKHAFNHLLMQVTLPNNDKIYLDASQKKASENVFASTVLKGKAMVLNFVKKAERVNLRPKKIGTVTTLLNFKISEENIEGSIKKRMQKLGAFRYRKRKKIGDFDYVMSDYKKYYGLDSIFKLKRKNFLNIRNH